MADVPPLILMSDMKPIVATINLGNTEYGLRFTLNAIDEIQDHFQIPIAEMGDLMKNPLTQFKNIRWLLTLLINENIDCVNDEVSGVEKPHLLKLDERYVGRQLNMAELGGMRNAIMGSVKNGSPVPGEEDEGPNAKSE